MKKLSLNFIFTSILILVLVSCNTENDINTDGQGGFESEDNNMVENSALTPSSAVLSETPVERIRQTPHTSNPEDHLMVHQVDFPLDEYKSNPRMLEDLALQDYADFESYYPKHKGKKGEEVIDYPDKLQFSFELFESPYHTNPYKIVDLEVVRNDNGFLVVVEKK